MGIVFICLFLDFIERFWYDVAVPREVVLTCKECYGFLG